MHDIDRFVTFEPHINPEHADGFPLLHPYLEQVWLPIIGPSATLILRTLGRQFGTDLNPYAADLDQVALQVGLGVGGGRHGAIRRTVNRIIHFGHGAYISPSRIEINALVPRLAAHRVATLPATAQQAHHLMTVEAVTR